MLAFRGKVPSEKVREKIGENFDTDTFMLIGVKGWHILVFPIDSGEFTNIAAFCDEPVYTKKGQEYVVTTEDVLSYFPGRSNRVDRLLRVR